VFAGRRVILAGAVAVAWTEHVETVRSAGAADVLVVATEGRGAGALPDARTVVVEPPEALSMMERLHHTNGVLADPPGEIRVALDDFDPTGDAVIVGSFTNTVPELAGRPFLAHRRPQWVALEDKVVIDAFWDRAGVRRRPSAVVPLPEAPAAAAALDAGAGTVWAADAREGFHGGATWTRWVGDDDAAGVVDELGPVCATVRVMPFVEGIPCAVHGIVLPDGVAVVRPVEMVMLRRGRRFVYGGCATYWDPPPWVREEMRAVARRAGARLATEVGFRGAFTVDGVAAADGFWPTELNPRFGGGLMTIARADGRLPLLLLNDLIVAGHPLGRTAGQLEDELVERGDAHRGGGTWMLSVPADLTAVDRHVAVDAGTWRWAADGEPAAGHVIGGEGFLRNRYSAAGVPIGPPSAPLAAAFWDFADSELGTGTAGLTAPPDPFT
jgi:hypothetical protein